MKGGSEFWEKFRQEKFIFDTMKDKIKKLHDFLVNRDKVKAKPIYIGLERYGI